MGLPFDLLSAAPLNATRPRRVEDLAGPERSRRPGWRSGRRGEGYEAGPRGCPAKTPPSPLPPIDPATRGPAGPPLHPPCLRIQRVGLSRVDRHVPESPPTRPAPCRSSAAPGGATPATSVRDMCHQALCHRPRAGFGDALAEQDGRLLCAPHPDRSPRPIRHSRRPQQRLRLAITACPESHRVPCRTGAILSRFPVGVENLDLAGLLAAPGIWLAHPARSSWGESAVWGLWVGCPTFEEKDVSPRAAEPAEALPVADDAKPAGLVEGDAGVVFGEDAGLDGPDSGLAGGVDERLEDAAAYTSALPVAMDVDGVLDYPGVAASIGDVAGRSPADDRVAGTTDQAEIVSMGGVPDQTRGGVSVSKVALPVAIPAA